MSKKKSIEEVKQIFINSGYIPLFDKYNDNKQPLLCMDKEGYKYQTLYNTVKNNKLDKFNIKNPYTIENILNWMKINNNPYILLSKTYNGSNEKLKFNCPKHGGFEMSWDNFQCGKGCKLCGIERSANAKKIDFSEIESILKENNLKIINKEDYESMHKYFPCYDSECYKVMVCISNIKSGQGFGERFNISNPYTLENIELWINKNNKNFKLKENQEYKGNDKKIIFKCYEHGEFKNDWSHIQRGQECPFCSGVKVNELSSFYHERPELLKYFININDAKEISKSSGKIVKLKCPNCGSEKEMMANKLVHNGFSCDICSDGISIPEKFIINLLNQLNVKYMRQYKKNWTDNRKYDFCFKLNDNNKYIIETHGRQHYEENTNFKQSLQEVQENDGYKKQLAMNNGVKEKNYIVIDCRYSEIDWIKKSILNSRFIELFDLYNIDWNNIWINCQKSYCTEACELWNSGIESTLEISKVLGIDRATVTRYLKIGTKYNICNYNTNNWERKINQYDLQNNYIKTYDSISEAQQELNVEKSHISDVCKGKRKTCLGYIWKYV